MTTCDELLYEVYAIEFELLRQAIVAAAESAADPVASLAAVCRAYARYAQEHPGRYRAMTGVRGQAHEGWDPARFPGTPAFAALAGAVAAALAVAGRRDAEPRPAAASLWAWLHGVVVLRADRPVFPWPPMGDMLDSLVAQFLAAPYRSRDFA
ncbi:MAG TPA: TetR-like C-terminal domain-containing protein [Trebonia sp.]|jgi:hypothetical protein|nr:TetR-like C-terminal domain-containing protein [Trebonia sp.]